MAVSGFPLLYMLEAQTNRPLQTAFQELQNGDTVEASETRGTTALASQPTESAAGGNPVESLQSHMILTMSHWSSRLTCLLPATRVTGSNPLGGLK